MRREHTDNRKERMECPGFVRERRGKAALKRTDGFVRSSLHVTRYGKGSKKRKVNICVFCVVFNYEGRMQRFGSIAKVGSAHPGAVSKTRSAAAARKFRQQHRCGNIREGAISARKRGTARDVSSRPSPTNCVQFSPVTTSQASRARGRHDRRGRVTSFAMGHETRRWRTTPRKRSSNECKGRSTKGVVFIFTEMAALGEVSRWMSGYVRGAYRSWPAKLSGESHGHVKSQFAL